MENKKEPRGNEYDKINLEEEHAIVIETLSRARYESKEELIEIFKRAIIIYIKAKEKDIATYYITEAITYIISTRDDISERELKTIADQVSEEGGELIMTLAERLMEKGMEKGIEKGIEKGELRKAREMAKELIKDNMDIKLIAKYTRLSLEEIEEIRKSIMN